MKSILNLSFVLALSGFIPLLAHAQCTYTAIKSGNFSDPTVFAVTGGTSCASTPVSGSNATIVITGFNVALDQDYTIGKGGSIVVASSAAATGSLTGNFNLTVGDRTGAQSETQLLVQAGATVRVDELKVDKGTVTIAGASGGLSRGTLTTDCNVVLLNSSITLDGLNFVRGNLDLSAGGANNTLCGNGGLAILGCVFGGNGAINRITRDCAAELASPTVCAQQTSTAGCPGPIAGTNASERSCDALVTSTGPCFISVLPVELVLFTAVPDKNQGVVLRWATASEKNNEGFTVERSADGRNFRALATLPGGGSVQRYSEYRYIDEQPLPGVSYYRLRQRDFDGTTSYSPVQSVKLNSASTKSLEVYPGRSPQQWVASLALPAELTVGTTVQVLDAMGRVQRVTAVADEAQAGRWTLDLHGLPSGVYIVRVLTSAGNFSQRIAK